MTPPIEITGLSKTYRLGFLYGRKVRALDGLHLRVEAGQIYGLLGPNGAGKSTTIKILMNLVQASSGNARLFGLPPTDRAARRQIGFVPENPAPYEYLTGREFLAFAAQISEMPRAEAKVRVEEVLDLLGMQKHAGMQIRRYSKGMTQRIALAQAVLHRPKLLILDEPTSGLDPMGRRQVRDLIFRERDRGTTILFCTHIIPDIEAVCDRVAVLVGGKRIREGSVQELLTASIPLVEVTFSGIKPEVLGTIDGAEVEGTVDRLLIRAPDVQAQEVIRRGVQLGGRVMQVQPARFSLEQLFVDAVGRSGSVGGEVS